jgi:ribosomal protein L37AE/L43A
MKLMKILCLALVGLGILLCIIPGSSMIAFGAALAVLAGGGFVSLHIMDGGDSGHGTEYGKGLPFLSRFFKKKRERQYCPHCGAPVHFVSGLGPYAGLPGGWFCRNCRKEVSPPTRSPEYRREQRERRKL